MPVQDPSRLPDENAGSQSNNDQKPEDLPGLQKISKNPNPRANENLNGPDAETTSEIGDETTEVGSEITDGEDG